MEQHALKKYKQLFEYLEKSGIEMLFTSIN
jgi:hypothetical protein